ncbi:MAG: hypothetical protein IT379_11840 [Deltaproteobacteria bacterium]|nr:hypothetical protein [Deltaproteobacteria bacterium]
MTREHARDLLHAVLDPHPNADAEQLLTIVDAELRVALHDHLGRTTGQAVADRICGALLVHVPSGIRRKTPPAPLTIGIVHATNTTPTERLAAGVETIGYRAVILPSGGLGTNPAAEFADAFLITPDLSLADARDLAWIAANRDQPAPVIVWPIDRITPGWGKAIPHVIHLEHASFALLQKTLTFPLGRSGRSSDG